MLRRNFVIAGLTAVPLTARRGFAASPRVVLELFTSQGCSSCPPADALLGELAREPGVIALAWHVDYWNSLGWRDRFSKAEWTDRQKTYARNLNEEVYTPALVVNGGAMVVGSDRAAVRRAMESALPSPEAVTLRRTGSGLEAEINLTGPPGSVMLVTYVPEQATRIGAGENQGQNLVEYHVVRDAATTTAGSRLAFPPVASNHGAVLLVRDSAWRIIGAAELPPVVAG